MNLTKWNDGWKFWADRDAFALVWNVPDIARDVTLPHDAMMEAEPDPASPNGTSTGFRNGDCYTYVKRFTAPEAWKNQTVSVKFEGIYMNAMVYLNGQLCAKRPFGYTTFYAPLDGLLKYGEENELRVQVRAGAMANSRWYSGAGIYRDVYLVTGGLCHLPDEGIRVTAEEAGDIAVLRVETEVENREHLSRDIRLENRFVSPDGSIAASGMIRAVLTPGENRSLRQRITIKKPCLWDDEHPNLYTLQTVLLDASDGRLIDVSTYTTGIRTLSLDAQRGLRINGQPVKLRGACIHHDSGLLGAATFDEAQFRQIRKLKEAGFNAVRMSHHPMAPAMLRACDALGMYVMDELSDMWNRMKSGYDYALNFSEWWERDLEAMVRKDYNHPSVILYSIGNEIPEIGTDAGSRTAHAISSRCHALDPSRYTTAGINGVFAAGDAVPQIIADISAELAAGGEVSGNINNFMALMDTQMDRIVVHPAISERLEKACATLDVAGYNYMTARYAPDIEAYPDRVIVGSETYPPEIALNWAEVQRFSHVIGDFTWTGWDYIGEAGIGIVGHQFGEGGFGARFPAQLAYCGDMDITGFRRPLSYFREIVFGLRKAPYIAVQDPGHYGQPLFKTPWAMSDAVASWTWPGYEGKNTVVEVYAPGDEVELLLDGHPLGRQPSGAAAGYRALFEVEYAPGTLAAIAYKDGVEIGRFALETTGATTHIELTDENVHGELAYINVALKDSHDRTVTHEEKLMTLTVEGDCEALFCTGNPKPLYSYKGDTAMTWHGRAQIILRRRTAKPIRLSLVCEDGLRAELTV